MQPRPGMASAFLISGGAIALSGLSIDASASSAVAVGTDGTAPGTDLTVTQDASTADRGVNGGAIAGDVGSQITEMTAPSPMTRPASATAGPSSLKGRW